jgi:hypothetical protein
MLDLGAEYDALWLTFFTGRNEEVEYNLWPVPHVLKKMLQNEGVAFDDHHTRLNHGPGMAKLVRLGGSYDLLREEWFQKTLSDVHPAPRWGEPPVRTKAPKTPANLGWSFTRDESSESGLPRKNSRRTKRLTIIAEKQPSMRNVLGSTIEEEENACSLVLNTRETATNTPVSMPIIADVAAAVRPLGLGAVALALAHGPSPLQRANTASMLLADDKIRTSATSDADTTRFGPQPWRHEHTGVLGLLVDDERRRAKERQDHGDEENHSIEVRVAEEESSTSVNDGKKGKGMKKWLRSMFENSELARSMDRMGRNVGGDF